MDNSLPGHRKVRSLKYHMDGSNHSKKTNHTAVYEYLEKLIIDYRKKNHFPLWKLPKINQEI